MICFEFATIAGGNRDKKPAFALGSLKINILICLIVNFYVKETIYTIIVLQVYLCFFVQ